MLQAGAMSHPRVLVVEDDAGIADAVLYALRKDGMAPESASTVVAARAAAASADVVILDLGLPDGSGFSLLDEWRRWPRAPQVIVLTSRDEEADCVAALEAGADDYVTKPFSPRALVARVRAVLRRGAGIPSDGGSSAAGRGATEAPGAPSTNANVLAIDGDRRTAAFAGREVALTKTEFDLLANLAEAPGRVRTREYLVRRVWGDAWALTERTIDSHVKALRRKLEAAGASPHLIVTVRGVGFKLSESP